ncbi:NUDIX hydrolase [Gordonia hydrophobica]|uniref:NUDIX domain-containing protein n=1 Tax=Gordonia hydrophobica TaxID=40516 RepID=A0ABZ2U213_9ACTN|nr:NUDIX domain-containing protein [Gordonia hydrophobica]MBM7366805.1 8-oxo-dGTP pyrophosphatase MutT (NUDIX family) [Gordonia hydrophobica]
MTTLHAKAMSALADWAAPNPHQDSIRHAYLAFLSAAKNGCERACEAGHLTASVIVFNAELTHVLLTLHPRVGKWLQLGGHCEPEDDSLSAAALREGLEESGLGSLTLSSDPVQLHTHPITCSLGVPTRHLDVRYAAVAAATADGSLPDIVISDESTDLAWWPVDALPEQIDAESVPTLIEVGRDALRA